MLGDMVSGATSMVLEDCSNISSSVQAPHYSARRTAFRNSLVVVQYPEGNEDINERVGNNFGIASVDTGTGEGVNIAD